ncbi:MAG TPA: hypothetical protein VIK18_26935, partial [Pirellulales bacterium]
MRNRATFCGVALAVITLLPAAAALAGERDGQAQVLEIPRIEIPGLLYTPIGVTRQGTTIP